MGQWLEEGVMKNGCKLSDLGNKAEDSDIHGDFGHLKHDSKNQMHVLAILYLPGHLKPLVCTFCTVATDYAALRVSLVYADP